MRLADTLYEILILFDLLWEVYDKGQGGIWKALDEQICRILEFMNESAIQGAHAEILKPNVNKNKNMTARTSIKITEGGSALVDYLEEQVKQKQK